MSEQHACLEINVHCKPGQICVSGLGAMYVCMESTPQRQLVWVHSRCLAAADDQFLKVSSDSQSTAIRRDVPSPDAEHNQIPILCLLEIS